MVARHGAGILPPAGAMPMSSAVGPMRERLVEGGQHGDVEERSQPLRRVAAGARRVEDGHHRIAAVADDADGGLGAGLPELAFGEDDVAAALVVWHGGSESIGSPTSPVALRLHAAGTLRAATCSATPPERSEPRTGSPNRNAPGSQTGGVGMIWYRIPDSNRWSPP